MYDLKKDLQFPNGEDASSGFTLYQKGQTKLGLYFTNLDPQTEELNLSVRAYNSKNAPINVLPGTNIWINKNRIGISGDTKEVTGVFGYFYPETTEEGLAILKQIPVPGGTLADHI